MNHKWGPRKFNEYGWKISICARCGLKRVEGRDDMSSTGWITVYVPDDVEAPITKRAPLCEEIDE